MAVTLGIDTSYEVAVGLARDSHPLDAITIPDTRAHAETLMASIMELCAHNEVNLVDVADIALGMGPGPFTGLRVGIVTAQTLGAVLGIPVHGVCSLDVLAASHADVSALCVASDARRNEWYWARYQHGRRVDGPNVSAPEAVGEGVIVGPVAAVVETIDASVLAAVWASLPQVDQPMYLRAADAQVSTRRKSALPRVVSRRRA